MEIVWPLHNQLADHADVQGKRAIFGYKIHSDSSGSQYTNELHLKFLHLIAKQKIITFYLASVL